MKVIYPGSFNLFHAGHFFIYKRACEIFGPENVYLCIAKNPNKVLDLDFIRWTLEPITSNLIVTDGLIANLNPDVIIRGLRDASDITEELTLADWNEELGAKTIFIPCTGNLRHLSSSALRELYLVHNVSIEKYVPKEIKLSFTRWKKGEIC